MRAGMGRYALPDEEDLDEVRAEIERIADDRAAVSRDKVLDDDLDNGLPYDSDRLRAALEADRLKQASWKADKLRRLSLVGWKKTAQLVYERDGGLCHVCMRTVERVDYECGHIIDRMVGGTDRLSNLVTMCIVCNRMKPPHETRAEYLAWLDAGGWFAEIKSAMAAKEDSELVERLTHGMAEAWVPPSSRPPVVAPKKAKASAKKTKK